MASYPDPLNLIICGVGGQGNIMVSYLISRALIKKGYFVTRGETFGAAQRSGAVMSSTRISPKVSYGPLIPKGKAHIILSLEPLETVRILQKYGNSEVTCITNTHPIVPILCMLSEENRYPNLDELRDTIKSLSKTAWFIDASDMASKLGDPIVTNIVMMGALIGAKQFPLDIEDVEAEIRDNFPPGVTELNLKALKKGVDAIKAAVASG